MVWEWGEDTLATSIHSLRRVLEETPLVAGLNFDGRGLEHLATNHPDCLSWIREASSGAAKRIEIWGGTYTQPYGHMLGHESNARQRAWGVRCFERLLGERPRVFAEEEFDLFPQLPQMLALLGYRVALLFPQHTWHTPTIPEETEPVIRWAAPDGSSVPTVPYSRRCLMRGIPTALERLKDPLMQQEDALMITWLEVLDKPNWMWRTEFVLPYLRALLANPLGIAVAPAFLLDYVEGRASSAQVRQYALNEVFHGISVGKNGDALPALWRRAEDALLTAEHLAAWCSLLGRPYPQFDSYPEWQLNEAWRMLMQAQGHDAYECEGLTHKVGRRYAQTSIMLARDVLSRCKAHIYNKVRESPLDPLLPQTSESRYQESRYQINDDGTIRDDNDLLLPFGLPIGWSASAGPTAPAANLSRTTIHSELGTGVLKAAFDKPGMAKVLLTLDFERLPEPGILNGVRLPVRVAAPVKRYVVDSPFAVLDADPKGRWLHRQPAGDWLTSEQWEEWIERPITFLSFVSMQSEVGEALFVSRQNTLALATQDGMDVVLFVRDAWDEEKVDRRATIEFAIATVQPSATNLDRLLIAARAFHDELHPSIATREGRSFLSVSGNAWLTCVRKESEWLEVRLFETEGAPGVATLRFPWAIEVARAVNLLGEPMEDQAVLIEGDSLEIRLRPHQIVTLQILFEGRRTEYPDIDAYRDVWVG
jgi:hypothetical protein